MGWKETGAKVLLALAVLNLAQILFVSRYSDPYMLAGPLLLALPYLILRAGSSDETDGESPEAEPKA